jgi:hypothetical protein
MVSIKSIFDKKYRGYVCILLCAVCITLFSLRAMHYYAEGLALKEDLSRQILEYQRLKDMKPSLSRDTILAQRDHIEHLEAWIGSYFDKPLDRPLTQNASSKPSEKTFSSKSYESDLRTKLISHNIPLEGEMNLRIQSLALETLDPEQAYRRQKEALAQAFDCLLSAQPQSFAALKTYSYTVFKKKSLFPEAFNKDSHFLNQDPISYFKIKFCGYSESLRSFICLLHKKPYAFMIDRVRVKTRNGSAHQLYGFLHYVPGCLEFTLWIAVVEDFSKRGETL